MPNKKELIIFVSIIIIIAGLISLRLYIKNETRIAGYSKETSSDYEEVYQEELEKCLNDPEIHQCVAYVTDDLSLCNKWVELDNDAVERDWCFDRAFLFKKIALENIYPCDKMMHGSTKLMCNAIKTGEKSDCDSIEEGALKGLCNSMISNRESCGGLTSEDKEGCQELFKLCSALKQNKMEMCELLGSNRLKITCKALISNDPEICKNIKSCEDEAGLNAQRRIDGKNLDIGANHRNLSQCKKIVDKDIKNSCISVVNNDLELCKQVKNEYTKLYCIVQIAEIRNNFNLCGLLDVAVKEDCINYFKNF